MKGNNGWYVKIEKVIHCDVMPLPTELIEEISDNSMGIDSLFIDSLLKKNIWTHLIIDIDSTSHSSN